MRGALKWCFCVLVLYFALAGILAANSSAGEEQKASQVSSASTEAPSILVSETTFDFGEHGEMDPVVHEFTVKYGGGAVLHINDVRPG